MPSPGCYQPALLFMPFGVTDGLAGHSSWNWPHPGALPLIPLGRRNPPHSRGSPTPGSWAEAISYPEAFPPSLRHKSRSGAQGLYLGLQGLLPRCIPPGGGPTALPVLKTAGRENGEVCETKQNRLVSSPWQAKLSRQPRLWGGRTVSSLPLLINCQRVGAGWVRGRSAGEGARVEVTVGESRGRWAEAWVGPV